MLNLDHFLNPWTLPLLMQEPDPFGLRIMPTIQLVQRSAMLADKRGWSGPADIKVSRGGQPHERYVMRADRIEEVGDAHPSLSVMQSLSSKLDFIREQFGIGTSHLAEALGVGRPTVYAWQKGESKPQDERRDRVEALLALARSWQGLSREPLGHEMFEPLGGGPSIMQMMTKEAPDSNKIMEAFKGCLAERAANKRAMGKAAEQMRTRRAQRGESDLPDRVVEATMRKFAQM